jgi:c-di-GMP-binding flagellar brake protein YcgR
MKEILNKRRYVRFQVPAYSAYAAFRLHWPCSSIMGNIVDISLGGLAFRYIPSPKASNRSSHIDILLTDGSFCLNKVPVQTISDFEIDSETSIGLETRRCSVQFGDLTDNQKSDLRYFIQTYASADPEA